MQHALTYSIAQLHTTQYARFAGSVHLRDGTIIYSKVKSLKRLRMSIVVCTLQLLGFAFLGRDCDRLDFDRVLGYNGVCVCHGSRASSLKRRRRLQTGHHMQDVFLQCNY